MELITQTYTATWQCHQVTRLKQRSISASSDLRKTSCPSPRPYIAYTVRKDAYITAFHENCARRQFTQWSDWDWQCARKRLSFSDSGTFTSLFPCRSRRSHLEATHRNYCCKDNIYLCLALLHVCTSVGLLKIRQNRNWLVTGQGSLRLLPVRTSRPIMMGI